MSDDRDNALPAAALGHTEAPNDHHSLAPLLPPAPMEAWEAAVQTSKSSEAGHDFVASIRQTIETLSSGGDYPTIRTTAEFVGMSVRTLQRRLAQANASHHMLVARSRFATAAAVLERTDARILELALDLGYSDHANFTRAFRRWAGCAPRDYRSMNTPHEGVPDPSWPRSTGVGEAGASAGCSGARILVATADAGGARRPEAGIENPRRTENASHD